MNAQALYQSTDYSLLTREARDTIALAFEQLHVPHLSNEVSLIWNKKFKNVAGDAIYYRSRKAGQIRLSTKILPFMNETERINVYVHEAAHIADFYKNGYSGHGKGWKALMMELGYANPTDEICHGTNIQPFIENQYEYHCECGQKYRLTQNRISRMKNGTNGYHCRICKAQLLLSKVINLGKKEIVI